MIYAIKLIVQNYTQEFDAAHLQNFNIINRYSLNA